MKTDNTIQKVLMVCLTILATLILGTLREVKDQSQQVIVEFREYQKVMEKRVSRIEYKIFGDEFKRGVE